MSPALHRRKDNSSSTSTSSKRFSRKHKQKKSSLSDIKVDLHESHAEKEARRLRTMADPNVAVQQQEPSAAALEKSNMAALSAQQHKDIYGNIITDPDLSNPTRHRLERPLDTIRAFQASIDDSYHVRRASYTSRPNNDRAELESEMDYAGGGPVQPPNNPYGYNYPAGASRPGGPPMPTQPSSQAGMAWASAPPKIAPPRKPVVSGPDEKKRGFFRRKGKK